MTLSENTGDRILLVGSGGREHALAWKLLASPRISELLWAPGNPVAHRSLEKLFPTKKIERLEFRGSDYSTLANEAQRRGIALAVIGPDQALADGAADAFAAVGIPVFGPSRLAAQIEWSKKFAKEVMVAAGVPTPAAHVTKSVAEAENILTGLPWPGPNLDGSARAPTGWVLKADGLALGKGVEVCASLTDALRALPRLAGISETLVIEERLTGEEISLFALCDGADAVVFDSARDYKTLRAGNVGPNTGGMGAVSPVPGVDAAFRAKMRETIFLPVLRELRKRGTPFRGLLYAGLMGSFTDGFRVLEFNARFGDPETQALLPRLAEDLYPWLLAAAKGTLHEFSREPRFTPDPSVFVVAAAEGYPERPRAGDEIHGIPILSDRVFFAGVAEKDGIVVTSGGRVLGALGRGTTVESARAQAFGLLDEITFAGKIVREDIGQ